MSIFARSCSKCKKPWQDCSFVDIRACRHGLQIAPGRSWEAMLTRCCLRRGYERSPKGLWSCLGRLLARAGRSRARSGRRLGDLGRLLGRPERVFRTLQTFKTTQDDPKSDFGANLEPTWSQLGANLEPRWANLDLTWNKLSQHKAILGPDNANSKIFEKC